MFRPRLSKEIRVFSSVRLVSYYKGWRPLARNLSSGVLEVGNEVVPVLLLLETTKGHLGARNVLLGVLEVGKQSVLLPGDALLLVGVGVGEALNGASLAAEETVQIGTDLVGTALLDGVALSAAGLEEVGTLLGVTALLITTLLVAC